MFVRRRRDKSSVSRTRSLPCHCMAGGAGLLRRVQRGRAGAVPARASALARTRLAAALPGHPRQVQEQQVSQIKYSYILHISHLGPSLQDSLQPYQAVPDKYSRK